MEGSTEQLERLMKFLRKGPPLASVEKVNVHDHTLAHYQQFSIRASSAASLES